MKSALGSRERGDGPSQGQHELKHRSRTMAERAENGRWARLGGLQISGCEHRAVVRGTAFVGPFRLTAAARIHHARGSNLSQWGRGERKVTPATASLIY